MALWFKIAIPLNIIYWGIFCLLLLRRRWNATALTVGIFHMLFASVMSVAPIRALLDPHYAGYAVGAIGFEGRAVALPAALILGWALAAAWVSVGKGSGRWMILVALGDILFALSIGVSILLGGPREWKFQLGQYFSVAGLPGLFVLLCFFALPFVISAHWAVKRSDTGRPIPPRTDGSEEKPTDAQEDRRNINGFRYSEGRA
jgi:hypothetical protein